MTTVEGITNVALLSDLDCDCLGLILTQLLPDESGMTIDNLMSVSPSCAKLILEAWMGPPLAVGRGGLKQLEWIHRHHHPLDPPLAPCLQLSVTCTPGELPLLAGMEGRVARLVFHDPHNKTVEEERGRDHSSPLYHLASLMHVPPLRGPNGRPGLLDTVSSMTALTFLDMSQAMHLGKQVLAALPPSGPPSPPSSSSSPRSSDSWGASSAPSPRPHALRGLRQLNLAGCVNGPETIRGLGKFAPTLESLDLTNADGVRDADLEAVGALKQLTSLSLAYNTSITAAGLHHLSSLDRLERLSLRQMPNLRNEGLAALRPFTNLKDLDLSNCVNLSNDGLALLLTCTKLRALALRCCVRLTDTAAAQLTQLTCLEELDLSACWSLSAAALDPLRGLEALRHLRVPGFLTDDVAIKLPHVSVA